MQQRSLWRTADQSAIGLQWRAGRQGEAETVDSAAESGLAGAAIRYRTLAYDRKRDLFNVDHYLEAPMVARMRCRTQNWRGVWKMEPSAGGSGLAGGCGLPVTLTGAVDPGAWVVAYWR